LIGFGFKLYMPEVSLS